MRSSLINYLRVSAETQMRGTWLPASGLPVTKLPLSINISTQGSTQAHTVCWGAWKEMPGRLQRCESLT